MPARLFRTAISSLFLGLWFVFALPLAAQQARPAARSQATATPIQHLVVIFQENISFDHYFGTYPHAKNPPGEPRFVAAPGTPAVNGYDPALLTRNPNALNPANGRGAVNPFRLDRSQARTADQDHSYRAEQMAYDGGLMDLFPKSVGRPDPPGTPLHDRANTGLTMGYFDGNTVTALWNYAQRFTLSDNSFGTTYGPSTPGALNLISGQTNGVAQNIRGTGVLIGDGAGGYTDISDADPLGDVCSTPTKEQFSMSGRNIGDLLSRAGVSWGWFEGGFDLDAVNPNGSTGCDRSTVSPYTHQRMKDYLPHHEPFQYYASTANLRHLRPTSVAAIGHDDRARHQYGLRDFYAAVRAGNLPAVSFLKAPAIADGHAGYSDPLDEQQFIVQVVNFLQQRPEWRSTAVVIAYDDSDGWYDHQMGPMVNGSSSPADALTGGRLRQRGGGAAGRARGACAGALRLWTAPAHAGDFALGAGQLRGPHADRADLHHPLCGR